MEAVNVSGLKTTLTTPCKGPPGCGRGHEPRQAGRHTGGRRSAGLLGSAGVKLALATALFRDGHLSLARSARLAEVPLVEFITHLSRLGSPWCAWMAKSEADMDTLDQWLASA